MINPALQTDGYKTFHKDAYEKGINKIYSNFTCRHGKYSNIQGDKIVFVGMQYFIKNYLHSWKDGFFQEDKEQVLSEIKETLSAYLGNDYDVSLFGKLHDLGYLPLEIKALPEGTLVGYGVPCVTITNTHPDFYWLTNYIETVMSSELWGVITSATTAMEYKKQALKYMKQAGGDLDMIPFLCHDFSFRGMFGKEAAAASGFGHLCSFMGTDTIPAIEFAKKYYNGKSSRIIGASVPATEHSTVTSFINSHPELDKTDAEVLYVRYLMDRVQKGIVSHVSDSFDFFKFVTEGLPKLKEEIMSREGTLVIRPDSGDPVKVLCGDNEATTETERKGLIELLWDIFGGTVNSKGFKVLDTHIGAIYGDSITLQRQKEINERLISKGFVPNVVLGIGSYSYQMVTRDTHGSAVKCTYAEHEDGRSIEVYKDPITDKSKKSAKGLLMVSDDMQLVDQCSKEQEKLGVLETVYCDGNCISMVSLEDIRNRINHKMEMLS